MDQGFYNRFHYLEQSQSAVTEDIIPTLQNQIRSLEDQVDELRQMIETLKQEIRADQKWAGYDYP
jgi:chaperonin cofactor prefoldin